MGVTGGSGVQADRDRVGGHVIRAEETRVSFEDCGGVNGSIVTPPPHGEITWDSHATEPGSRPWKGGTRDINDVLPTGVKVGGMSGIRVPGESTKPWKTQGTLHVLILEVKGENHKGGPKDNSTVQSLWDARAEGAAGES